MQVQSGIGFDILKNPEKYFRSLSRYGSTPTTTQSLSLAPTKENEAKRAAQAQSKAASQSNEEKKNSFGSIPQTSETTRTRAPLFGNTYDSESEQRERLQRFGIPTTDSPDAYQNGDTFKIIKEGGATVQDYLDFFEGFRSIDDDNPTGIKNNPLAPTVENGLKRSRDSTKAVPHKNTASTSARNERDARVREQYAARERQIDFSDRNALIGELADIEAAKDHNPDSKWNKRLERAWRSGDRVTYEKVEREMAMQKKRIKYILENRDRTYDDNFAGQFGASYRAGRIAQDEALAWNKYLESPTILNKEYAESVSEMSGLFRQNNEETLADDATLPWLSQSLAGYLPQLADQTKAGATGAAGTGLTAGFMAAATGNPLMAGTVALKGAKAGYTVGVTAHSYDVMRGSAYKKLLDKGMDEKSARSAANDEALVSALVEMADTGVDINTVFDALVNPYKAGAKGMLKLLAKMGVNIVANVVGESVEEGLQEGVSIANESRDGTGIINLLGNTGSTIDSVITNADPAARQRILNAMSEGAKLSLMTAGPGVVAGQSINTNTTQSTQAKSDTEDTDGNAGENVAGLSVREKLLSKAKNPKVINAVNQLYRPGAYTGDGGTADAIRHEIFTGTATNGRSHIQKGQDWIRALIKIRTSELLTSDEKLMLDDLIDDLQSALKGD